ncbi:hypothetical protein GBA52_006431 [Prunus armeniaca]|nr:hypothetical protein GBA52_006431 [Prunus armeniaca]
MADQHFQPPLHSKAAMASSNRVTAGGSLLVLSGLVLAGTVIALTIATPLLVIFSPVLVPALITVALITMGFLTSGGFGVAAVTVLSWIYKYVTGKQPPGADQLDQARHKLAGKARDIKTGLSNLANSMSPLTQEGMVLPRFVGFWTCWRYGEFPNWWDLIVKFTRGQLWCQHNPRVTQTMPLLEV